MTGPGAGAGPPIAGGAAVPMAPGLRRFLERPKPKPPPGERCELCTEPVPPEHSHVVNLEARNLMCACRSCWLLFTREGAAGGRYRAVPERYLHDPAPAITPAQWDSLAIPVGLAFFFVNSELDRFAAFYPSPAGATESMLELDTWSEILAANPALAEPAPDVEAILVRRVSDRESDGDQFECWLVPIDACYELVGRVKLKWRGFDGGADLWADLDAFLAGLRERSRPVGGGG
jgi:uncharacterized protein DUF5947